MRNRASSTMVCNVPALKSLLAKSPRLLRNGVNRTGRAAESEEGESDRKAHNPALHAQWLKHGTPEYNRGIGRA